MKEYWERNQGGMEISRVMTTGARRGEARRSISTSEDGKGKIVRARGKRGGRRNR